MNSKAWLVAALTAGSVFVAVPGIDAAQAQTAKKLKCKGCVGKKQLGKKAVTRKAIKDKSVTAEKLAIGAKPTGGDSQVLPLSKFLTTAATQLANVTITAPGPGYIIATGTANLSYGVANNTVVCAFLNTGVVANVKTAGSGADLSSISQTTMFPAVLGNNPVTWACSKSSDVSTVEVQGGEVVAFFVPNRY